MTRILIVDDEFGLAETLRDLLELDGYEVSSAWNGQLALKRITEERPDLILLDVMMPIMDGRKLLHLLKANPMTESIPVIMMSGLAKLEKDELEQVGGFLEKPFEYDRLLSLVQRYVPMRS